MADFRQAIKKGIEGARKVIATREEIDKIFDDLNSQILAETEKKVCVAREFFAPLPDLDETPLLKALMTGKGFNPLNAGIIIIAYHREYGKNKQQKLAYWEQDSAGYPCQVKWGQQHQVCEDKTALVRALSELLQDPAVGAKILMLTKLPSPPPLPPPPPSTMTA